MALETIRLSQEGIALATELKEQNPGDWEMEELAAHLIFDEQQVIELAKEELRRAREAR